MTISLLHWTVFIFPLFLEYIWVHSWNQIIFSFKISQKRKLHTHTIHTRFSYKIKLIHIFTTHINTNIHIDISIFAALLGKRVHHGEIKTVHTFFLCLTLHGKWRWLRECIGTLELCQGEGSTVFQRGNTVYFVIHTGRVKIFGFSKAICAGITLGVIGGLAAPDFPSATGPGFTTGVARMQ